MAKRMILLIVLVVVFIATLAFVKFRQFQAMAAQFAAMQPPPEAVTTIVAQREEWPATHQRNRHRRGRAGRDRERGFARHR